MKYLIRADKLVFSGNMQMIMKYISDFYGKECDVFKDKDGNFSDLGKFKQFIESKDYKIRDKVPASCRCEGTGVTIAEFRSIYANEGYSITKTAERLHISERQAAQLARKVANKRK